MPAAETFTDRLKWHLYSGEATMVTPTLPIPSITTSTAMPGLTGRAPTEVLHAIRSPGFSAMLSHCVTADRYGRPGKGNDKGKVEGLVAYRRRNFMLPPPGRFTLQIACRATDVFTTLQRLLEARQGKAGKREYVQVLRLLERFDMDVRHLAIKDALQMRAVSFPSQRYYVSTAGQWIASTSKPSPR